MNSLNDSSLIFRYHRDMISEFGADSSRALGWLKSADQQTRFALLAGIADLNGHSVLDAGCGYGDLLPFLSRRYPSFSSYCGVEQIPELVDVAISRYGHLANVNFISRSFLSGDLPVADYVLASGSLNYGSDDPGFIFNAITLLYNHCRLGLGFNLLRSIATNGLLVAYPPELILDHCRSLSNRVVFTDGYADEDFTVFIYREQKHDIITC